MARLEMNNIAMTDKGVPANKKINVKTGFVPKILSSQSPLNNDAKIMMSVRQPTWVIKAIKKPLLMLGRSLSDCAILHYYNKQGQLSQ